MDDNVAKAVMMQGDYILIQRDKPAERRTPGGVVLPAKAQQPLSWAQVLAVGPQAGAVQVQDRVLLGQFAGSDVDIGDHRYTVIRTEDVFAIAPRDGSSVSPAGPICG
ncbi:MAG: co-chaperone GroES [bacterium]